jgi:hypothetical protein
MLAIHFICKRTEGTRLRNLTFNKVTTIWRSGLWDLSPEEAQSLVGGWIYLHPTKTARSEFGGIIEGFESVTDRSYSHAKRIVFLVNNRPDERGHRWRGRSHGMAHNGGAVEAIYAHERGEN